MKMQMLNNITKTTAITNSKASIGSKVGVEDINLNVNLPKIKNQKGKHLQSIDDDYEEDYDERVPQKPKNIRRTPTDEGIEVKSSIKHLNVQQSNSQERAQSNNPPG